MSGEERFREDGKTAEKIGEREETTSTNKGEMRTNMEKEKENIMLLKLFAAFKPQRNGKHLRQGIPERQKREMRSKWICTIFVELISRVSQSRSLFNGYVRLVVSIFCPKNKESQFSQYRILSNFREKVNHKFSPKKVACSGIS